jgi:hypothetical protein
MGLPAPMQKRRENVRPLQPNILSDFGPSANQRTTPKTAQNQPKTHRQKSPKTA